MKSSTFYTRFRLDLLKWFSSNARRFAWRRTSNPYQVLITELLLRKTTAGQVRDIYAYFFKKFPTPRELYAADESELREIIRPLGLEMVRASTFKRLAGELVQHHAGSVPFDEEQLLRLPGVGKYAANATRCFAFGKRAPLVDVNVIRVISRVFGVTSKKPRARDDPLIWSFVEERLLPRNNFEDFNLALLDFAAGICRKRAPQCSICFATSYCAYFQKLASGPDNTK